MITSKFYQARKRNCVTRLVQLSLFLPKEWYYSLIRIIIQTLKVILFGDSTIWSNFSFFAATNEALLGNLLRACEVKPGLVLRMVALFLGLGCVIGVYWYCRNWTSATLILLISLAFAFPWYGDSHYTAERLESSPGSNIVVVDGVHSSAEFRADIRKGTKEDLFDYSTFYAWLSRIGISPGTSKNNCYGVPETPVIIINPDKPFSSYELEQIDTYLRTGGRILLLDDPLYIQRSSAGHLLAHAGISYVPEFSGSIHDPEGPALSANLLGVPFDIIYDRKMARGMLRTRAGGVTYCLSGTVALLVDAEGFVICGRKDIGQGSITVFCRSAIFSEFVMGDVSMLTIASNERVIPWLDHGTQGSICCNKLSGYRGQATV